MGVRPKVRGQKVRNTKSVEKAPEGWRTPRPLAVSELQVRVTVSGMPLTGRTRSCSLKLNWPIFGTTFCLVTSRHVGEAAADIAGTVAAMTESELGVLSPGILHSSFFTFHSRGVGKPFGC